MMEILYVFIGVLGWVALKFTMDKRKFDKENKKFDYKGYASKTWDDWVWGLIGGYVFYFSFFLIWLILGRVVPELKNLDVTEGVYYGSFCGFAGGLILQKLYKKYLNGSI